MAYPSVLPALLDALVAAAKASEDLTEMYVSDGPADTDDPGDYLMIGVDDPDGPDWARSASGERDWETIGGGAYNDISETGDITCVALSWTGDTGDAGQKDARDTVYGIAEALAGVCRNNPTMGIDRLLWVLYGGKWDFLQGKFETEAGLVTLARFEFQLRYEALI